MDVDSQGSLGAMEEEAATQSIRNEGKTMNEADKAGSKGELRTAADKEQEVIVDCRKEGLRCYITSNTCFRLGMVEGEKRANVRRKSAAACRET